MLNISDEVKNLFLQDSTKKKLIIEVEDGTDIDNDNIEFESFSMTESLCSQDNIKFGLCESAHCEFTTVGYNYDLKDKTIKPQIMVEQPISYEGLLDINWWKDQSGAVSKGDVCHDIKQPTGSLLWSDNWMIDTTISTYDQYFSLAPRVMTGMKIRINSISSVSGNAPATFNIGYMYEYADGYEDRVFGSRKHPYSEASNFTFYSLESKYENPTHGKIARIIRPILRWYDSSNNELTNNDTWSVDIEYKEFMVYMYDDPTFTHYPEYDPDTCYVYDGTIDSILVGWSEPIPLGVYHVTDLKLEHTQNLVKQKVTAYDNIVKLEQNAANWYTQYMFAVTTDDYLNRYDVEYARQIFSSYFDFVTSIGLDSRNNYTETLIATYDRATIRDNYLSSKRLTWQTTVMTSTRDRYIVYTEIPVANVSSDKLYMVDATNFYDKTDEQILNNETVGDYASHIDSLKRGLVTNGGVIIEAYKVDDSLIGWFVVNRRDYFMLPDDSKYLKVYCSFSIDTYYSASAIETYPILNTVSIYSVDSAPELANGAERLFYYNLSTREISDVGTSISGRDVVRSLLELCGCFFRLDRTNGLPEFIYCTKGGLYPRNDLYPADDLYPRAGTDQILPNGRYMSATQDNYQVQNYGKIQIIVDSDTNSSKSVCEYEYIGDSDLKNTYLIDNNIFYSNKNFNREYDHAYTLLQRMFEKISNMGYVPNITEALGMPWIECGDRIGIMTYTSGFESFIFRRTMKGIQLLIDTYESTGDEYTEAVKEFGYEEFN